MRNEADSTPRNAARTSDRHSGRRRRDLLAALGASATAATAGCLRLVGAGSSDETSSPDTDGRETTPNRDPTAAGTEDEMTTVGRETSFSESFSATTPGYDQDQWVLKDTGGGNILQPTNDGGLRLSANPNGYIGLQSIPSFTPPLTLSFDVREFVQGYGSGAYVGFINPDDYPPGGNGTYSGAAPQKKSTDAVVSKFQRDGKDLGLFTVANSPLGDGTENVNRTRAEIENVPWNSEVNRFTLRWESDRSSVDLNGTTILASEQHVPTTAMPLFVLGHTWVSSETVEVVVDDISVTA